MKPYFMKLLDNSATDADHSRNLRQTNRALAAARKSSRLASIESIKHEGEDCGCPLCNVDCQDDYEYFSGTGQYPEEE